MSLTPNQRIPSAAEQESRLKELHAELSKKVMRFIGRYERELANPAGVPAFAVMQAIVALQSLTAALTSTLPPEALKNGPVVPGPTPETPAT